jgi:hypothetical protein
MGRNLRERSVGRHAICMESFSSQMSCIKWKRKKNKKKKEKWYSF